MTITIRPASPETDFPRFAELLSLEHSEPVPVGELIEEEEDMLPEDIRHHLVAVNGDNHVIGFASATRQRVEPDGYFHLTVLIDPEQRRKRTGSRLYEQILQFMQGHGATKLFCNIKEKNADCMPFAEQRGFTLRNQMYMSKLDLHTFDEGELGNLIETLEAQGIRFTSLAAEGNTDQARRQLYDINRIASIDDPAATDDHFDPFEDYANYILDASWFQPDGQFMALDGDKAVGMSGAGYFAETNSMYTLRTGVDRAYRGRKIAQALKLLVIRHGKAKGADFISTQNDSVNAAMLAINRKLGFVRQQGLGQYGLVKALS